MGVIEDIYRNTIQPSKRRLLRDKAYAKAENQIKQYYLNLNKSLSQYERETLDKLIKCYDIKVKKQNIHCFTNGFKTGLSVAVKSLN